MATNLLQAGVQPNEEAQPTTAPARSESWNRRGWLKSALAAGAAVAGVAALSRAEAQEQPLATKEPGSVEPPKDPVQPQDAKPAEYGMMVHVAKIKGNVTLYGFKDGIVADHCSFSSSAHRAGDGKVAGAGGKLVIEQSAVLVDVRAGKWIAEFQQACYDASSVGDVVISQIGAVTDSKAEAVPAVLQKVTLTNAVVTSVQQSWDNGDGARSASISFSFDKILFEIGTKPADFTLRNITSKAV